MIEEVAVVSRVKDFQVSVKSLQTSSCGKCSHNQSCGTSLLDKYLVRRDVEVEADIPLTEGDKVLLGVEESALLKGSLLLYIAPLFALFLGASFGNYFAEWYSFLSADLFSAGFAFLFFMVCLLVIHKIQHSFLMQYFARPVVLRKL